MDGGNSVHGLERTPSVRPALVGNPDDFHDLVMPTGAPKKLNDFTNSDRPQLGLHIITFGDLTVVTLYFPHTLMDAMGQKALLDAWCLMLNGKVGKVRTPHGVDTDPLATLGMTPVAEHKLAPRQLGMLGLIGYGLGQAMELFRTQESRMVCVPQQTVEKVRKEVMADLGSPSSGHAVLSPFLSDGDILCAWWTRIVLSQLSPYPTQTVVLNHAYDIRRSLQEDLIPEGAPYISDAVCFIPVILTAKDILEKPLSYTALAIRNAITELGTREQVEAFFSLWRRNPGKLLPILGDRNMRMITFSNWTKANLYELDFSAAIAKGYDTKVAKPRYIQNTQSGLTLPNAFPIMGKDGQGNYWLSGYMNKAHWAAIEQELAATKW
ncbi:hypothetical protein SLS60_003602 [Paraconiothyrium brasiliense]|uniref:Uncharacterized protein n=1 Tax=Paraconiothyrium brasiliense TaxID=300254 RepID=A0ABR3RP41_9PLEO